MKPSAFIVRPLVARGVTGLRPVNAGKSPATTQSEPSYCGTSILILCLGAATRWQSQDTNETFRIHCATSSSPWGDGASPRQCGEEPRYYTIRTILLRNLYLNSVSGRGNAMAVPR